MLNIVRLTAFAAVTAVGIASAQAAIGNRAECYDVVIAACNQGSHPVPCANSGMDQCDKQFPKIVFDPIRGWGNLTSESDDDGEGHVRLTKGGS